MKTMTMRMIVLCGLAALAAPRAGAQAPDTVVRKELPRLEIPEITIVGKKAITLPFARKGEIYDVPLYEAPPPDTGLLTDRPEIELPPGSLPRYEQREQPWRVSAEASAGRFGTLGFLGYVDYHTQRWNLSTTGGYRRTDGHASNTGGDEYHLGGRYSALVTTDNDLLRNFRLNGDLEFRHDAFGMPGILPAGTERGRDNYTVGAGFSSVKRDGLVMDFSVAADILSVNDEWGGADSGVTVTSPAIDASVAGDMGTFRLITGFGYESSSLDYPGGASSPSLWTLAGALQWSPSDGFFLRAGGEYSGGSGTDDVSRSRLSPRAELEWRIDAGRKVNLWARPGMTLATYSALAAKVPYLAREIAMIPEARTIDAGGSVWYNSGMLTLELSGEYSRSDNRPVLVTDSGRIRTEFAPTWESRIGVEGTLRPGPAFRVRFNGAFRPSRERGGDSQLPMTPIADAGGHLEFDLTGWWTLNAAARYWSKQNVDRAGSRSIGSAVVLDAGASTTLIPRVLLSGGVRNLLDKQYEWWSGYPARGLDFYVTARARL
jgi:outer membrane receptor protein involved in Fe transport